MLSRHKRRGAFFKYFQICVSQRLVYKYSISRDATRRFSILLNQDDPSPVPLDRLCLGGNFGGLFISNAELGEMLN